MRLGNADPGVFEGQPLPVLVAKLEREDGTEFRDSCAALGLLTTGEPGVSPDERFAGGDSIQSIKPTPPVELLTTTLADQIGEDTHLPSDHPPVSVPDVTLETYLGGGAQGCVYSGRVVTTGRVVAVKILHGDYVKTGGRAAREAMICAKLSHPNVIRIFHVQPTGDFWVVIMELVQGRALTKSSMTASPKHTLGELADALLSMESEQIVHRDVKPDNIMVRRRDGSPVLVDFGIAVDLATPEWTASRIAGTPFFMPPEVFVGEEPHPAWDAYSLGMTVVSCLLGDEAYRIAYNKLMEQNLRTLKLSGEFEAACIRAIEDLGDEVLRDCCEALINRSAAVRREALLTARSWAGHSKKRVGEE